MKHDVRELTFLFGKVKIRDKGFGSSCSPPFTPLQMITSSCIISDMPWLSEIL